MTNASEATKQPLPVNHTTYQLTGMTRLCTLTFFGETTGQLIHLGWDLVQYTPGNFQHPIGLEKAGQIMDSKTAPNKTKGAVYETVPCKIMMMQFHFRKDRKNGT